MVCGEDMLESERHCAQRAARRSSSSSRDSTRGTSYPTVDTPTSSTDGRDGVYVLGTIERRSPTTSGASSTSRQFPLTDAPEALRYAEAGGITGKVLLTPETASHPTG